MENDNALFDDLDSNLNVDVAKSSHRMNHILQSIERILQQRRIQEQN